MRIAIVGCGNIAYRYAQDIAASPRLSLVGATDLDPARAERLVQTHGGRAFATLDELLAVESIETIVNLTVANAHVAVSRAALEAGKHVHSEKPLALTYADARELVELADRRSVRLSAAPTTLLGEAQQTAWKLVRDGALGRVRVAYAEANWGLLESWHPDPRGLYEVGPLADVGVYPLMILTALFGPVRRVQGYATTLVADRLRKDGRPFRVDAPDFCIVTVELEDGVVARLTTSFYVPPSKQRGLELHGDDGSLYMPTWSDFDSRLELQPRGGDYAVVAPLREPHAGIDWSRALVDLADALDEGRLHRSTGEHAAHVVEVLEASRLSVEQGGSAVDVLSGFRRPEPFGWAR
ncbi:MAG TPA: Gfo/Idh/MocA family oxidoreductase [Gaiellaceae bacterium]